MRRRGGLLLASLFAASMLMSCTGAPVTEETDEMPSEHATLEELRDWVGAEVDLVSDLTGLESSWRMLLDLDLRWAADRAEIFERSHLPRCSLGGGTNPAAVQIDLLSDPLDTDPLELAERVRDQWESDGWDITQIGPGYYRADREDRAMMTVEGAEGAGGKLLALTVQSACSSDPSVAY